MPDILSTYDAYTYSPITSFREFQYEPFGDPFVDFLATNLPYDWKGALRLCERVVYRMANGIYYSAMDRIISYFITDLNIEGASSQNKKRYLDYLNNTLGIKSILRMIGLDYLTYGNSFISVLVPFRSYLVCKKCGVEIPFDNLEDYDYRWTKNTYVFECEKCKYRGPWEIKTRKSTESDSVKVKRWNPLEINLKWDPYTDDVQYYWDPPEYYVQKIREGDPFYIERLPKEFLDAVLNPNKIFKFSDDAILHLKEPALSGLLNRGWGISPVLVNMRQALYVQVLHRYNEVLGLDYIMPLRFVVPAAKGGGSLAEPLFSTDMAWMRTLIMDSLKMRRRDPASWTVLPFPVQLVAQDPGNRQPFTHQAIEQGIDVLLTSLGVPIELYRGTMSLQAAPMALRLFESKFNHLIFLLNRALDWIVRKIVSFLNWEDIHVELIRPTHIDDLNKQMARLQLMAAGQISRSTALQSLGIDFEEEQRKLLDEEKFIAKETKETQREMERYGLVDMMGNPLTGSMIGQPSTGGQQSGQAQQSAPAAPVDPIDAMLAQLPRGPNQPVTPQDLESSANVLAQQIFAMPETMKDSALRKLKQKDRLLWSLVSTRLDEIRESARRQGLAAMQQAARTG